MFKLDNKIAVITGGGSGIGKAISILFGLQGATVCIIDINDESEMVVEHIRHTSGKAFFYKCNISSQEEVKNIVQEIIQQHASIDILVNNAGVAHVGTAENTSAEDFERLINVNIKGVYNCLHTVIPGMKENGGGVILNMSSIAAIVGLTDRFAYSMTKGAVAAMTLSVAKDYLADNIRCNCISPARVHTAFVDGFLAKNYPGKEAEMFEKLSKTQPIGRMAKPDEIAHLILYLCSPEASFITGCDYPIDGGFVKLNN